MPSLRALLILLPTLALLASTEDDARRVLASRCFACHTEAALGGLRLDSREAILRGGKSGPAILAGRAAQSRMFHAVLRTHASVKPMPPDAPLKPGEVDALKAWIDEGLPWSGPSGHWSFQPLRPLRSDESIDAMLAAAQKARNLSGNTRADKRTLIRRVHFDLIGLPPEPAAFELAFNDHSPAWFDNLVARLLTSSHFGEKWGRHWLDVARFGEDDYSGTAVIPYPNAWRYRDWVIQALNQDMPYDRFLMAQLAGDLMNDPALLPATGLLGLGPWYYGIAQPAQSRADERHDRVDMVSRGMLGVTVACARCHDHKYDPFTAHDYYALAGVFASTAYKEYPLVPDAEAEAWKKQKQAVDDAEKALNKFLDEQSARLAERFAGRIANYMVATVDEAAGRDLEQAVLARWKTYLSKREEFHPFLNRWFDGDRTPAEAASFQQLILDIAAEKKKVDEENRILVDAANKAAPKVARTIVLPGGYRSEEDFNPGAYIPSKSLERDRFVAYNRTFGERTSPLRFDRELTAKLLPPEHRAEYDGLKNVHEERKKALPPRYPYLDGAAEFQPWDLNLHIRGNPEQLGEVIPRRFPLALSSGKPVLFNEGSGRLQLAGTIAHHPLAARVAVNRMWMALFGQGLVRTPSNFGRTGDRPAVPELLEYLASRFVNGKYSMKTLLREIVLSDTYQRASSNHPASAKADPENRYVWRQNRRRLEAEPLRDAMLAVAGELDRSAGGESKPLDDAFHRRTIYAKTSRFQQDETLSLFDLPSASVTCEQRVVTNVPLQKLFLLNSGFVRQRAAALAKRLSTQNVDAGVTSAYFLIYQRAPRPSERRLAHTFLSSNGAANPEFWEQYIQVLLAANEFAYVD
jgi:hypothetical protein